MTTTLGRPAPPKPTSFTPEGAPAGVETKFVTFWQEREFIEPISLLAHTNGAEREGSVTSAWNHAHAKPKQNTCPHYQIDRYHPERVWARKMLPSNRRGIGNGTVSPSSSEWLKLTAAEQAQIRQHGYMSMWSLVIETADLGWPTLNRPDAPGGTVGYDLEQGEMLAACIAYEAIVWGFPLAIMTEWWGPGVGSHTDPFGFPFTTTARGKSCPGDAKKRDMREWILPRAIEIHAAWTGAPVVRPPVVMPPVPTIPSQPTPIGAPTMSMKIIVAADGLPAEADFAAWFLGQVDQNGIAQFIEWTGEGGRPEVQQRLREIQAAGGTFMKVGIGSLKNCTLIGPMPPDGTDIKHLWRRSDFANVVGG